jgi:hypothetical protein
MSTARLVSACAVFVCLGPVARAQPASPSARPVSPVARAQPTARAKPVSRARHRQAIAANTAGLRFFRAGQLPRSAFRFRDALALDPDYALAHYNLACVTSRLRETAAAVDELRWLATADDPVAEAKLDKARIDPDLDFVSVLPTVRELLGLAPFAVDQPLAWLAERHGVWSAELPIGEASQVASAEAVPRRKPGSIDDCALRSYSFAVREGGELTLTVREGCAREAPRVRNFAGSARVDGDGSVRVEVPSWAQRPAGVRLVFAPCPGLDAPGSCFMLDGDKGALGPFHRGLPGMSPMRARRNVATARP